MQWWTYLTHCAPLLTGVRVRPVTSLPSILHFAAQEGVPDIPETVFIGDYMDMAG